MIFRLLRRLGLIDTVMDTGIPNDKRSQAQSVIYTDADGKTHKWSRNAR